MMVNASGLEFVRWLVLAELLIALAASLARAPGWAVTVCATLPRPLVAQTHGQLFGRSGWQGRLAAAASCEGREVEPWQQAGPAAAGPIQPFVLLQVWVKRIKAHARDCMLQGPALGNNWWPMRWRYSAFRAQRRAIQNHNHSGRVVLDIV